ncbi:MAG: hypothetical protein WBW44_09235, partial [Solirubrobacterales bacterium]
MSSHLAGRTVNFVAIAGALVLASLTFGASLASASGPFSGKNGNLAVVKAGKGPMRMGVLNRKGNFRTLYKTSSDDFIQNVSFSPSGSRIAFALGFQPVGLAIAKASTGRQQWLDIGDTNVSWPTWASNGRIAFSTDGNQGGRRSGTYTMRSNGRGIKKLFARQQVAASPDLKHFAELDKQGNSHFLKLLDA